MCMVSLVRTTSRRGHARSGLGCQIYLGYCQDFWQRTSSGNELCLRVFGAEKEEERKRDVQRRTPRASGRPATGLPRYCELYYPRVSPDHAVPVVRRSPIILTVVSVTG